MAKSRGTSVEVLMADKTTRKCVITRKGLGSNGRISVRCIDRDSRFYGRTYEIIPKRVLSYGENADALVELTVMEADENERMKKYYDKAQEGKTPEEWLKEALACGRSGESEVKRGMFISADMPDGSFREGFVTRDGISENGRISMYAFNSSTRSYDEYEDRRYEIDLMQLNILGNRTEKWVVRKKKGMAPRVSCSLKDMLYDDDSWTPDNKKSFALTGPKYLDMVEKWEDMCNPSWLVNKEAKAS